MNEVWVLLRRVRPLASVAIALQFVLACFSTIAEADAAAGRSAFEKGDFARAMTEWQAAADHGDPDGEFGLGNLYEFGAGDLAQNYNRAAHWYKKAAEQGNTEAEYRLALLYGAGGDNFDSNLVEAYKWATLAARSEGVWGSRASNFKGQLNQVTGLLQRGQAEKLADNWVQQRTAPKEPGTSPEPAPPPPAIPVKPTGTGCPGWPFPALPCTEHFPALAGPQGFSPAAPAIPVPKAVTPVPATPEDPLKELNNALAKFDCAALRAHFSAPGSPTILGTIPDSSDRANLMHLAQHYFPSGRIQLVIDVVPPPLCRSLVAFDMMARDGLVATDGLEVRLNHGSSELHEGDGIEIAVRAPAYPVNLRIDYFSLDGKTLHLEPDSAQAARLEAGAAQAFDHAADGRDWQAGGKPFGTEMIAIIATPLPLPLASRQPVEPAANYLRDLKEALDQTKPDPGRPNLFAKLLVKTNPRLAVGK